MQEGECLKCPSSCKSCRDYKFCYDCTNLLTPIIKSDNVRTCPTCIEKFEGCDQCNDTNCIKCLSAFLPLKNNKCNVGSSPKPKFNYEGFGNFKNSGDMLTFRLYMTLSSGIMYGVRVSFTIKITSTGRRLDQNEELVTGECIQDGASLGDESDNSNGKSHLVILECGTSDKVSVKGNLQVKPEKFTMTEMNGEKSDNEIPDDDNILYNTDISKQTDVSIEDRYSKIDEFHFLDECKIDNNCIIDKSGNATFSFKGKININESIDNKIYYFDLDSQGSKKAICNMNKLENETNAKLACQVQGVTDENNITFYKGEGFSENQSNMLKVNLTSKSLSCIVKDDKNGTYSYLRDRDSSSKGISAGAIVAIIVVIIVVLIITIVGIIYGIRSLKSTSLPYNLENIESQAKGINEQTEAIN